MPSDAARYPDASCHWPDATRILPAQYPEQTLWSALVEEEDLPGALALLKRVDPAIYADLGTVDRSTGREPKDGVGSGWVMRPFTWGGRGRFNGPTFSAFYAVEKLEMAIAETVYHQERVVRDESAEPIDIQALSGWTSMPATSWT